MKLPLRLSILGAAMTCAAALAVGAAPTTSPVITDHVTQVADTTTKPMGLAYGDTLKDMSAANLGAAMQDAKDLGATYIRSDLSWDVVQPNEKDLLGSPTVPNFAKYDAIAKAAKAKGLNVLFIPGFTPTWAHSKSCGDSTNNDRACPPDNNDEYAIFVGRVASHYADAVTYGAVDYEVWNEPNLSVFWINPNAVDYGALLAKAGPAIKAGDADARVVFGGLTTLAGDPVNAPDALTFYGDALQATGVCSAFDYVGVHPYSFPWRASSTSTDPNNTWQRTIRGDATGQNLFTVGAANGCAGKQAWITEYGAPTGGGTGKGAWTSDSPVTFTGVLPDHVSPEWQAAIMSDSVAEARRDPNVYGLIAYSYKDVNGALDQDPNHYYGLRKSGTPGQQKPAWVAFRDAIAAS
jgi:hypothetical protein